MSLSPRASKAFNRAMNYLFKKHQSGCRHVAAIFNSKGSVFHMSLNGQSRMNVHAEANFEADELPKGKALFARYSRKFAREFDHVQALSTLFG